jgi:hypothetical protein
LVVVLRVDIVNMVAGDHLQVFAGEEVQNSSGTQRDALIGEMYNAQTSDYWQSPPLLLANGWDFKIKQVAGTGRAFPWSIWQV